MQLKKPNVFNFFLFLKNHNFLKFGQLVDVSVLDLQESRGSFLVFYMLKSFRFNVSFYCCVPLACGDNLVSVTSLFSSANWIEREVWDMFGIFFYKNKDLRRILTDYGFEGHPLLKSFPLVGYREI